jgi:hypothetical protein
MRILPSSPRTRRRLFRLSAALAVVAVITGVAVFARSPKQPSSSPAKNAPPAEIVKQSKYVSPADRRAIDRTLDEFIPAALDHSSPLTAWRLAGPDLKDGTTLREWRNGTSPVPYYPARGKTFHDWTIIDAGRDYVDFNLLVHPRKGSKTTSTYVFAGSMLKRGGRWLVNGLYTTAIFARPTKTGQHEVGPADFGAGPAPSSNGSAAPQTTGGNALSEKWLFLAGGVILVALLFPLGFGIASMVKDRRNRKRYAQARSARRELPPLPRSYSGPSRPGGGGSAGGGRH